MVKPIGKLLLSLTLITGFSISPSIDAQNPDATALADKMLERLGGRANWAALRNTINGSQQNRANEPTVVYAVITMDFERPRFRIETTAQDLHLIRLVDGENSWRLRGSGNIEDVPEALFASEMQWYRAHLYRTIHRLAARDPELSLRIGSDSRLEVFADDTRMLWFKLDAKGEPYAFGAWEDDIGNLSGPWDFVKDGIHHPRWVSSPDGTWRAAVKALEINIPLHDSMFGRPKSE
jgi:hypothetical protein